jgi:hypothetical protein
MSGNVSDADDPQIFKLLRAENRAYLIAKKRRFAVHHPWGERGHVFEAFVREDYPANGALKGFHAVHERDEFDCDDEHLVAVSELPAELQKGCVGIYRVTDAAIEVQQREPHGAVRLLDMAEAASVVLVNSTEQARVIVRALREAFGDEVLR